MRNDIPEKREFQLENDVKYNFGKYVVITKYIPREDYYETNIYRMKLLKKTINIRGKNRFKDYCYRSSTERQATRIHNKVVSRFLAGRKEVKKLGNGNLV